MPLSCISQYCCVLILNCFIGNNKGGKRKRKYLCNLLEPHVPHDYNVGETFSFVHEINHLSTSGWFMVSFVVESLFTSIPLDELP